MERNLFTVGYEGESLESFLSTLRSNYINYLIDVREVPLSRKKGFSKTALSETLTRIISDMYILKNRQSKTARGTTKNNRKLQILFIQEKTLSQVSRYLESAYHYVTIILVA
jgi:uncharacterized protein (DUF488 family)